MSRDPTRDAYTGLPKGSWRQYENRNYNGDRSSPYRQSYTVQTVPSLERQSTGPRSSYDTYETHGTHKSHSRSDPRNRVTASYMHPKPPVSTAKTYNEGTDVQTQQYYDFKGRSDSLGVTDYRNENIKKARRLLHKPNAKGFSPAELRSGKLVFNEDEYEVAEVWRDRMNGLEEPGERVEVVKDGEFKSLAR
ncbi:uncharacterized protein FOMMEDRAFT_31475 [Fomitiporia mediterranea MF3/22]|uniref:uncharacterized protein n=1 Tax=Fomitiporia mediterranea (strain MF3/22) TaxID=694068 RepID=UPI0004408498|nr:uncharacterized protein FOMMEDRAFT_31475 [Fomitiporia mediterranea MF3/22]EJC98890.1 hypothetical protein FOMMEDRAFT_31475 [Fomitiporia mediterranea MF3/22]